MTLQPWKSTQTLSEAADGSIILVPAHGIYFVGSDTDYVTYAALNMTYDGLEINNHVAGSLAPGAGWLMQNY